MTAAPHLRDLPDLARVVGATTLRPTPITPHDLRLLDIVADVEGWSRGWWAGCVHRRHDRMAGLWVLVFTEQPRKGWRQVQALVGRVRE